MMVANDKINAFIIGIFYSCVVFYAAVKSDYKSAFFFYGIVNAFETYTVTLCISVGYVLKNIKRIKLPQK
jgi:ABC-type multidrug transport system permease subunit